MNSYFKYVCNFYDDINKLCKKNEYNLVLHKHLGDVFYAIAVKPFFEAYYGAPLHFIVRPQHEFLIKMFGIKNYSVYDLDLVVKKNKNFQESFITRHRRNVPVDFLENIVFQAMFPGIPVKKSVPFVCDNIVNDFMYYDNYWCYRWVENMGIGANIKFLLPMHSPDLSENAKKKLQKIAPLDKIVLIAPEAATFCEFDAEFWNIIADAMHAKGYKIIVNSKKYKINHGISAFDIDLSLQDIVAIGLKCAYVFALRSGLCDVMVGAGKRLYAFYPAQGRREMYSLTKPFAKNTMVNEVQIWNWKLNSVVCDGIDLTPKLQKYINKLHKNYFQESFKRLFSIKKYKHIHTIGRHLMRDLAGISKVFLENNVQNPIPDKNSDLRPIYTKTTRKFAWTTETKQSWLNGILTFKKDVYGTQKLRFCGLGLYSKTNQGFIRTSRLFGIPWHKQNLRTELLDKIITQVNSKYDGIYISRHNIGETFVYLSHLQQWIKKNGSKKPVVIVWQEKDIDFYKMFLGKNVALQYLDISAYDLHTRFTDEFIEYKGRKIFCPTPEILQNMLKIDTHPNFYQYICQDFDMTGMNKLITPRIDSHIDADIQNKIKAYFKKPFVVLIPDATSLKVLSSDFWRIMINKLTHLGYDVFINSYQSKTSHNFTIFDTDAISFDTNVAELYTLAKRSKGVISMASGIGVLLTSAGVKMDLIYTDVDMNEPFVNSAQIQEIYSVYHLPNTDKKKVQEYDANSYTPEDLINAIMKRY